MIDNKIFYLPGEEELISVNVEIHAITPNNDSNCPALLKFEDGSEMVSNLNFMKVSDNYVYSYEESVTWPLETIQERIDYIKRALVGGFERWLREGGLK
jgi:hypothetical protein